MNERLKTLRKEEGLTQKEFAEQLGIDQPLVAMWEKGTRPIPAAQIKLICHEYGVRREWLQDGEGEMYKPEPSYDDLLIDNTIAAFEELSPVKQQAALAVLKRTIERGQWLRDPNDPFIEKTRKRFSSDRNR